MEVVSLTPRVEPEEQTSKKAKVGGPYTNWHMSVLRKSIYAAVKQHKNLTITLNYLRTKHKILQKFIVFTYFVKAFYTSGLHLHAF